MGENFIAFSRQNVTALCRENVDATEIDTFKATIATLVLENIDFIGDRELDKVFFASDPDLPVDKINNSLKSSSFSNNLKPTTNQSLNEFYYCITTKNNPWRRSKY